jgi:hypothetical protein
MADKYGICRVYIAGREPWACSRQNEKKGELVLDFAPGSVIVIYNSSALERMAGLAGVFDANGYYWKNRA